MNVVRLVANTVRRQTAIFRSGSTAAQPLIADPETEPYKYAIQRLAIYNLTPGATATTEEKIQAIAKIGHLCWTGGLSTAEFTAKNYMPILSSILDHEETHALKLQVVRSLGEICTVRQKAKEIIGFLQDDERLRKAAKQTRDKFVGYSSDDMHTKYSDRYDPEPRSRSYIQSEGGSESRYDEDPRGPLSRYNDENGDAVGRPYKDSNRDASPEPSEEKKRESSSPEKTEEPSHFQPSPSAASPAARSLPSPPSSLTWEQLPPLPVRQRGRARVLINQLMTSLWIYLVDWPSPLLVRDSHYLPHQHRVMEVLQIFNRHSRLR